MTQGRIGRTTGRGLIDASIVAALLTTPAAAARARTEGTSSVYQLHAVFFSRSRARRTSRG